MPYFPWGEDDDEAPEYPDLPGDDGPKAVSSPDPDDALDDED